MTIRYLSLYKADYILNGIEPDLDFKGSDQMRSFCLSFTFELSTTHDITPLFALLLFLAEKKTDSKLSSPSPT